MKREIPLLLAFLAGLGMILAFFIPTPFFKQVEVTLSNWTQIVIAFAIFLALFSLIRIHGEKISRQEEGWGYSVVLLGTLFLTTCSGIFYGVNPWYNDYAELTTEQSAALVKLADKWRDAKPAAPEAGADPTKVAKGETETDVKTRLLGEISGEAGAIFGSRRWATIARNLGEISKAIDENRKAGKPELAPRDSGPHKGKVIIQVQYFNVFQWLYEYVYTPLQATMFSLLAFYMASAAFRAFRARTIEGTLLLGAAFLVMIGRTSVGYWLNTKFCWMAFPEIQEWIMSVPTTAGQRAVMIGAALGVISASLRMLLGLEQTYLGGE